MISRIIKDEVCVIHRSLRRITQTSSLIILDMCEIKFIWSNSTHHDKLCSNLFENILKDPYHKLYDLLPERCENTKYNLRHPRMFDLPKYRTNRFRDTFIVQSCIRKNAEKLLDDTDS